MRAATGQWLEDWKLSWRGNAFFVHLKRIQGVFKAYAVELSWICVHLRRSAAGSGFCLMQLVQAPHLPATEILPGNYFLKYGNSGDYGNSWMTLSFAAPDCRQCAGSPKLQVQWTVLLSAATRLIGDLQFYLPLYCLYLCGRWFWCCR